ncbi:MAG: hypothetical protein KAS57_08005 [Gammaproteobacteria bacterium]|nr:hypothetical protein [Gammaproteobacteria bacterium]
MLRRFTTYVICFSMIGLNLMSGPVYAGELSSSVDFNESELLKKYPDAKVIRVSPGEYLALEKKLQKRGYRQSEVVPLQLAQNNIEHDAGVIEAQQDDLILADDCAEKGDQNAGEESLRVMLDFTEDMMNSSNGSSGDDAAVVFVIIGTVVVVVWALYVFKYFYDVSLGNAPCGRWNELAVVKSSASSAEGQHARFDGLRYSTGFRDGSLDVGIGFELGQTDILLSEVGVLELKGRYWLLGPILRWRLSQDINPSYFQMNFVAGTTEHDAVGLLAKASLGLLFGIGDSMQLGLNWGAMNINLNGDQGIISERSQYHYLYGINIGFKF